MLYLHVHFYFQLVESCEQGVRKQGEKTMYEVSSASFFALLDQFVNIGQTSNMLENKIRKRFHSCMFFRQALEQRG
jgi:hypothetical protein